MLHGFAVMEQLLEESGYDKSSMISTSFRLLRLGIDAPGLTQRCVVELLDRVNTRLSNARQNSACISSFRQLISDIGFEGN